VIRTYLGFRGKEIYNDNLEHVPEDENDVVVISNLTKSDTGRVLTHDTRNASNQLIYGIILGTVLRSQDLGGVEGLQGRKVEGEHDTERVDKEDASVTSRYVRLGDRQPRKDCHDGHGQAAADKAIEHERATSGTTGHQGTRNDSNSGGVGETSHSLRRIDSAQ
jgi:hypothetical protein